MSTKDARAMPTPVTSRHAPRSRAGSRIVMSVHRMPFRAGTRHVRPPDRLRQPSIGRKYSEILWRACRWPAWLSRHAGAGVLVKGLAGLRWWRGWLCPGAEVFGVGGPGQEPFKAGA